MSSKVSRVITNTLAAGAMVQVAGLAETFYLVSSTGTLGIKPAGGLKENYGAYQGKRAYKDEPFRGVEIYNDTGSAITFTLFYGFGEFIDNTKVFSISGAVNVTQSEPNFAIPDNFTTTTRQVQTGAAQLLIAANPNRTEVWLWTDETNNLAYFAESAGQLASPEAYQKIGLNLEGFTKLQTKGAIYVKAAAAVVIGAIEFV